ncbi:MAG: RNase adapter RapZ [Anaerovoracaceae bacterium]|nr:RNase adapter RapZ [Anaerovoracaceae bacterium]
MEAIIVTGLSGAGKTQAIDCLEDMGYYCIDNMPPALIKSFIDLTANGKGIDKAAFVIDVRGGKLFDDLKESLDELKKDDIDYKILYLEATDRTLLRRYNETRRSHPLSEGGPVATGLRKEREMLEGLRKQADFIIDTSNLKSAQLWAEIKHLLTSEENRKTFMINVMSFGYKRGTPLAADLVFDMRFIPNPYYVKSLRPLTGNNAKVSRFVLRHQVTQDFIQKAIEMIDMLIPYYMNEGKYSLNIGIGCTGGHHRSVAVANEIDRRLKEMGKRTTLEHRDL